MLLSQRAAPPPRRRVRWLTLQADDNDVGRFAQHLSEALGSRPAAAGQAALSQLDTGDRRHFRPSSRRCWAGSTARPPPPSCSTTSIHALQPRCSTQVGRRFLSTESAMGANGRQPALARSPLEAAHGPGRAGGRPGQVRCRPAGHLEPHTGRPGPRRARPPPRPRCAGQFTSWAFTRALDSGLLLSMGSIGDCYDCAVIESFWSRMQVELLDRKRWRTRVELANAIFEYLEIFRSSDRSPPHSPTPPPRGEAPPAGAGSCAAAPARPSESPLTRRPRL